MLGAGLLARNAVARGLTRQAVGEDVARAGLEGRHRLPRPRRADRAARGARLQPRRLRLHDLHRQLRPAARRRSRAAVDERRPRGLLGALRQPQLRGPHQPRREDELPRLAAARRRLRARRARWTSTSSTSRSASTPTATPVYLRDIWPSTEEIAQTVERGRAVGHVPHELRRGLRRRRALERRSRCPTGDRFAWDDDSTYVRQPPYFEGMPPEPDAGRGHRRARACSRCSATASRPTTSRPPARSRRTAPPARYLIEHGVEPRDFNSYGSRRGNHEVMMRGTFANIRLRNQLAPGHRGRRHAPPAGRRADVDLRRGDALRRGGRAARRPRGQGVRLGLVARLGGEGHAACSACAR